MAEKKELYKAPVIKPATLEELREISQQWNLACTDEELTDIQVGMNASFETNYQRLSELVTPTLPVKYPRTAGYRPSPEENPLNAWFRKCDIKGAPDGILKSKCVAIKDNVCVAGVPMINGSQILDGYTPDVDATVVTRILDAGGKIVGKANCEYLCLSSNSYTNCTGPVLNPLDTTRTTGGSSSGSAALVCNGEVDMAIGGDQGGSIRAPASLCGLVGLKPTWGLVPCTGAMGIETTVDHVGPITRTVKDCALFLQVNVYRTIGPLVFTSLAHLSQRLIGNDDIHKSLDEFEIQPDPITDHRVSCPLASEKLMFPFFLALYDGSQAIAGYDHGFDPRQPMNLTVPNYSEFLQPNISGKRVGVVKEGYNKCEDDVVKVVRDALDMMTKAGAIVEEISIPMHSDGVAIYVPIAYQGGFKCLFAGNGHGYHWKGLYHESMQEALFRGFKCRSRDMHSTPHSFILTGSYLEKHYGNKFYGKAQNATILLRQAYDKALDQYDVLVMPTVPEKAPKLPEKGQSKEERPSGVGLRNTLPFNLTGHPSLSINAGYSEGLPIGMMMTGKHFDETTLLQMAYAWEQLRDGK